MTQVIPLKRAGGILGTPEAKRHKPEVIDLTNDAFVSSKKAWDTNEVIEIQEDVPSWSSPFRRTMSSIARKTSPAVSTDSESSSDRITAGMSWSPPRTPGVAATRDDHRSTVERFFPGHPSNRFKQETSPDKKIAYAASSIPRHDGLSPELPSRRLSQGIEQKPGPIIPWTSHEIPDRFSAQIWRRTLAYRQSMPVSRTALPHAKDFLDEESPLLKFSFNQFVASLRLDLIKTYLQCTNDLSQLLLQDFEDQIVALYNSSKIVEREKLVKRVASAFEDRLTSNMVYTCNMRRHHKRGPEAAKAKSEYAKALHDSVELSHSVVPYLESLSFPQLETFSRYSLDLQTDCLRRRHRDIPVAYDASSQGILSSLDHVRGQQPSTVSRSLANEADFEKFLDEVQQDEGDKDEGTNTMQEVAEAAAFLEAIALPNGKFTFPGLTCSLHPHQVIGIAWMSKRERPNQDNGARSKVRGGLLADAMGLGKTVQALGLMMQNPPPKRPTGSPRKRSVEPNRARHKPLTTLIVCPVALIHQWAREIGNKAPGFFRTVCVHHGPTKMRTVEELRKADIIITSYGTLAREYPVRKHKKNLSAQERAEDEERIDRDKGPLFRMKFFRIILDEAHTIKNPAANVSVACCNVDAVRQWCLTGTPLQNKLDDIFPILSILQVPYFRDRPTFREKISRAHDGPQRLRGVLTPFLMRRKKDDKIAGQQVLVLPKKEIQMTNLELDKSEQALYRQVEAQMVSEINKYLLAGTAVKKINHIFVMILRLRQLCIHPYLILEHLATKEPTDQAGLFATASDGLDIHTLVPCGLLKADVSDVAICGICSSEATDPMVSTNCWHCFCKDCVKDTIENEESDCPVCSSPVGVLKRFNADMHKLASMVEQDLDGAVGGSAKIGGNGLENVTSTTMSRSLSLSSTKDESEDDEDLPAVPHSTFSKRTLISLMSDTEDEELPELTFQGVLAASHQIKGEVTTPNKPTTLGSGKMTPVHDDSHGMSQSLITPIKSMLVKASPSTSHTARHPQPALTTVKGDFRSSAVHSSPGRSSMASAGNTALESAGRITASSTVSAHRARYVVDPSDLENEAPSPPTKEERKAEADSWQELLKRKLLPSTKLTAVEGQLSEWMEQDDSKMIVFSQFVKALDLLDRICERQGWRTLRYHGSMTMREREATIAQFEEPDGPRILLMSLKAGGVGLNLVCASKVLLLDFWWNHACESQAIDRCHRMGQVREVTVVRTYFPGTVEEKILALQEAKLKTAGMVLGETEGGGKMAKLGLRELLSLFGRVTRNSDGVQQIEAAY